MPVLRKAYDLNDLRPNDVAVKNCASERVMVKALAEDIPSGATKHLRNTPFWF